MVIERDPGEFFLAGTMAAFVGPAPFGWVERIDAESLEPLASSPELPCGDHVWCGAVLAHCLTSTGPTCIDLTLIAP
jgi:hypothetical protein